jgi:hypothetical protein
VRRPIRCGKWRLTRDGSSTFAVAMPARAGTVAQMKTTALGAPALANNARAARVSDPSSTLWMPMVRAAHGASRAKNAKHSTGRVVTTPAVVALIDRPDRSSGRTGPTLTATGRRLKASAISPTTRRIC